MVIVICTLLGDMPAIHYLNLIRQQHVFCAWLYVTVYFVLCRRGRVLLTLYLVKILTLYQP